MEKTRCWNSKSVKETVESRVTLVLCSTLHQMIISILECRTPRRPNCIFPFSYNGTLYNACIDVNTEFYWCPVEMRDGIIVQHADYIGECEDSYGRHLVGCHRYVVQMKIVEWKKNINGL